MIEFPHADILKRDKVACHRNLALSRRDAVPGLPYQLARIRGQDTRMKVDL